LLKATSGAAPVRQGFCFFFLAVNNPVRPCHCACRLGQWLLSIVCLLLRLLFLSPLDSSIDFDRFCLTGYLFLLKPLSDLCFPTEKQYFDFFFFAPLLSSANASAYFSFAAVKIGLISIE
jgi:hypothetical protein